MTLSHDNEAKRATIASGTSQPDQSRIRFAAHFIEGEASGRGGIIALIIITMFLCGTFIVGLSR